MRRFGAGNSLHKPGLSSRRGWSTAMVLVLATVAPAFGGQFAETESFASPATAVAMVYSPSRQALVIKDFGSAIATINLTTHASTSHPALKSFTDIALSPSGDFVYAADYGGENWSFQPPTNISYVHRLDLSNTTWDTKSAYVADNIQVLSDSQFFLTSQDQWISFTFNDWGAGPGVVPLNAASYAGDPGYWAGVYFGNFRYDANSGRLLHGNTNSSSQEIHAFKLVGNNFVPQEDTGIYGTAQGFGYSVTLATDGSAFYYGKLQVDPLNVSHNLRVFPEEIVAATADVAFGNGTYYDAHTGDWLGALGFPTTVYALNASGSDFWAYDAAQNRLRHFDVAAQPPQLLAAVSRMVHGSAGTFDVPLSLNALGPATEPRQGPNHTIVFKFDRAVGAATTGVSQGTAVAGSAAFNSNHVIVPVTGVPDKQYVTFSVDNVLATGGAILGSASVRVGFLTGDVNQNRVVSVSDLGLIRAQLSQPVTSFNFLRDLNANGAITVSDLGMANASLTHALPPP